MALKTASWVFYNESQPNEKIVVQDAKSAETLAQVLKSHPAVWVMKSEESVVSSPSASTAVVTPPPLRPAEERRTHARFSLDLRVILICGNKSFRSISRDVSLGGMKLKNVVPKEFIGDKCIAYLSNAGTNENIEMICQVIPDPQDPRRVQFADADENQLKRLMNWLVKNEPLRKVG